MQIRSELNTLAGEIRTVAMSWNGSDKIKIGEIESTTEQIAQNILEKLNKYQVEEKSLKGRIETTQNLVNALNELHGKTPNPDGEKGLISAIRNVKQAVSSAIQTKKDLEGKGSAKIQTEANQYLKTDIFNFMQKIKDAAFRTLKSIGLFESHLVPDDQFSSIQMISFLTLEQDLETFLSSHNDTLTPNQRVEIQESISLLQTGAEMHGKMINLLILAQANEPDDMIEMKIADIAYEIENAIDKLKIGQQVIIPGGCQKHAVLYEIQRVRDKEYHFSIFNTGLGNEFGQTFVDLLGNQSRTPLFTGLTKDIVTDQKFLMDLIRFKAKPSMSSMDPVHELIQKQLGQPTTRELHDKQSWGTCSFDSVSAFLEYKLHPYLFIPFQYDMMLRARSNLNSLLPKAAADKLFPQQTLDFIDKKSCETIAEWKKKYEAHCVPIPTDNDLVIAKNIHDMGIHDEATFKTTLQQLVDQSFSLADNLRDVDAARETTAVSFASFVALAVPTFVAGFIGAPIAGPVVIVLGLANWVSMGFMAKNLISILSNRDKVKLCIIAKSNLETIQEIIEKISPQEALILKIRRESLAPSCLNAFKSISHPLNRANLAGLNLHNVMTHLENRYLDIALCVAPLLNSTFSPLREALQGCKMLPTA